MAKDFLAMVVGVFFYLLLGRYDIQTALFGIAQHTGNFGVVRKLAQREDEHFLFSKRIVL